LASIAVARPAGPPPIITREGFSGVKRARESRQERNSPRKGCMGTIIALETVFHKAEKHFGKHSKIANMLLFNQEAQ
jgi:hypothetical protein